ncbi:hypothetical protein [Bradyrhizobium sp. SZCCHNRI2010]|uniref:hypothetical protein n=1 Tax=Bradyrhizobium sp. SZCCHNRI2010 TaxID=3057283 RepID=UPI0028EFBB4D|nr:hypothetical protein [Bradyrhizobium sp. SZCCHNRI2010]
MLRHTFDHTPTAQEVFDQACVFFANSEGPSAIKSARRGTSNGYDCVYRNPDGRVCVAGYFLPDSSYDDEMDDPELFTDGSDVRSLVKHFSDKVPSWFGKHVDLLKQLQQVHDDETNWTHDRHWDYTQLTGSLIFTADEFGLNHAAVQQVRSKIPKPEFTAQDEQLLRELQHDCIDRTPWSSRDPRVVHRRDPAPALRPALKVPGVQ